MSVEQMTKLPVSPRSAVDPQEPLRELRVNGFAVVQNIATMTDLSVIRQGWQRVMDRSDTTFRELGERTGAPQIQEVQHITARAPEIMETEFFKNAKAFSED
jgi:alpha-D-ribose 1-methylphosphonate 5-triphosphate synthase subunit PhnH